MAEFAILIYEDPAAYEKGGAAAFKETIAAHGDFAQKHGASIRGGNAASFDVTSIRQDGSISDSPYHSAREHCCGYYVIEVPDKSAAIEIAKDVPHRFGGLEVRAVMDTSA